MSRRTGSRDALALLCTTVIAGLVMMSGCRQAAPPQATAPVQQSGSPTDGRPVPSTAADGPDFDGNWYLNVVPRTAITICDITISDNRLTTVEIGKFDTFPLPPGANRLEPYATISNPPELAPAIGPNGKLSWTHRDTLGVEFELEAELTPDATWEGSFSVDGTRTDFTATRDTFAEE